MIRQHDLEQLAVEPVRARLDLGEVEPRLEVEIVGAGAVLEIEIDQAGRRLRLRAPLLSRISAVWIASVVTPAAADGRAGRCRFAPRSAPCVAGAWATRAQVRTSSTGDTGLTRKSATRICTSVRARSASKVGVIDHDRRPAGEAPAIRRSSAASPPGGRIEIDHHDGGGARRRSRLDGGQRAADQPQLDLVARPEGRAHRSRRTPRRRSRPPPGCCALRCWCGCYASRSTRVMLVHGVASACGRVSSLHRARRAGVAGVAGRRLQRRLPACAAPR